MNPMWPPQCRAVDRTGDAIAAGHRRICLVLPTGGGKTRVACELIKQWAARGLRVVLYTNRRMLVEQLSDVMTSHGIKFGIRAAGHPDQRDLPIQLSSIQTEASRVLKREKAGGYRAWPLHMADRVIVDEAHLQTAGTAREIIDRHVGAGAVVIGLTATPIGIGHIYRHLIVAGTNSDLRQCGALVPARHFAPDEPDLKHVGKVKLGEDLSEQQQVKAIIRHGVFGRVVTCYRRLNPNGRPALLFAPGVAESVWFAEQFYANGIPAAHIDGETVWINGRSMEATPSTRAAVLHASRTGEVKIVCNRFVLREGIDMPHIEHGILACVFGSLSSYIQSGGRLLRASPSTGKTHAIVQDHGGAWHKHGSLNSDRTWELDLTPTMITGTREERLRQKLDTEPARCPNCAEVLTRRECPCGYVVDFRRKSRPVVQADGTLKEQAGDIYFPRRTKLADDTARLWESVFYRAKKSKNGMTFSQAYGLFYRDHGYWPPRTLPLMPADMRGWYERVADVPYNRLVPRPGMREEPTLFDVVGAGR